jgi:hypothetical protein
VKNSFYLCPGQDSPIAILPFCTTLTYSILEASKELKDNEIGCYYCAKSFLSFSLLFKFSGILAEHFVMN